MMALRPDEYQAVGDLPQFPSCENCALRGVLFEHEVCTGIGMVFVPSGRPMAMIGVVTTMEGRAPDSACGPKGNMFVPRVVAVPRQQAAQEPWYRRFLRR